MEESSHACSLCCRYPTCVSRAPEAPAAQGRSSPSSSSGNTGHIAPSMRALQTESSANVCPGHLCGPGEGGGAARSPAAALTSRRTRRVDNMNGLMEVDVS